MPIISQRPAFPLLRLLLLVPIVHSKSTGISSTSTTSQGYYTCCNVPELNNARLSCVNSPPYPQPRQRIRCRSCSKLIRIAPLHRDASIYVAEANCSMLVRKWKWGRGQGPSPQGGVAPPTLGGCVSSSPLALSPDGWAFQVMLPCLFALLTRKFASSGERMTIICLGLPGIKSQISTEEGGLHGMK